MTYPKIKFYIILILQFVSYGERVNDQKVKKRRGQVGPAHMFLGSEYGSSN